MFPFNRAGKARKAAFSGFCQALRMFPQGVVMAIFYFGLPRVGFQKHQRKQPCGFEGVFISARVFGMGHAPLFLHRSRFDVFWKTEIFLKIAVRFCKSFVSMLFSVLVRHTGQATFTDREFPEILCGTQAIRRGVLSLRRSPQDVIKSRKSLV